MPIAQAYPLFHAECPGYVFNSHYAQEPHGGKYNLIPAGFPKPTYQRDRSQQGNDNRTQLRTFCDDKKFMVTEMQAPFTKAQFNPLSHKFEDNGNQGTYNILREKYDKDDRVFARPNVSVNNHNAGAPAGSSRTPPTDPNSRSIDHLLYSAFSGSSQGTAPPPGEEDGDALDRYVKERKDSNSNKYSETTWERVIVHNNCFGTRDKGCVNLKSDKEQAYRQVCAEFRHCMVHPHTTALTGVQGVTGPRNDKLKGA